MVDLGFVCRHDAGSNALIDYFVCWDIVSGDVETGDISAGIYDIEAGQHQCGHYKEGRNAAAAKN